MFMQIPSTFSFFPVNQKRPLVKWSDYSERFPTQDELKEWKEKFGDYQKGIATGSISKILVLDDDGGLDATTYPLPRTWTVRTPRGGTHYYYKWTSTLDSKVSTKTEILPKVDVRGTGGFAVFYGFERPYYTCPLALPPQWLIDLLPNKNGFTNSLLGNSLETSQFTEILNNVHNGNRNDSFTRLAGSLRARGYNSSDMFNLLVSKAREVGFREQELRTICESVSRYAPSIKVDELNDNNTLLSQFLNETDIVNWISPGVLADNTINIIAGLQESRKSWILLDLALALATGTNWLTKFSMEKRKVLLIDQERPKSEMKRRLLKLINARNVSVTDVDQYLLPPKVGTTIRLNQDRSYEAFYRLIEEQKPEVILVDSLKTFQTGDITNNQSMQDVFERIKTIRTKFNVTFVILHHENKGAYLRNREGGDVTAETIAGASVINEVPEGIFISANHETDTSMLYHVKNSYGLKQTPILIKVEDVDNGIKINGF